MEDRKRFKKRPACCLEPLYTEKEVEDSLGLRSLSLMTKKLRS